MEARCFSKETYYWFKFKPLEPFFKLYSNGKFSFRKQWIFKQQDIWVFTL